MLKRGHGEGASLWHADSQSDTGECFFLLFFLSAPAAPSIPAASGKGSLTALTGFVKVHLVITLIHDIREEKSLL